MTETTSNATMTASCCTDTFHGGEVGAQLFDERAGQDSSANFLAFATTDGDFAPVEVDVFHPQVLAIRASFAWAPRLSLEIQAAVPQSAASLIPPPVTSCGRLGERFVHDGGQFLVGKNDGIAAHAAGDLGLFDQQRNVVCLHADRR